ncbi:hypothetical protein [Novosphingobium barchaimii]|uniref:hypothetical protein n=1 Tax=Novosphingobium barchaimii TaxID=1420591 RepID=UPI0011DF3F06|nr:hypothetical protein [Novosphingobium barchaimii]
MSRQTLEVQRAMAGDVRKLSQSATSLEISATLPDPLSESCAPGEELRTSDLCAQWFAARAAGEAARWSYWTFWLGLVSALVSAGGLIAIIATIKQGRHANQIAQDSADHQLRAYLGVSEIKAALDRNGHITARLLIRNYGITPARNISAAIKGIVTEFPSVIDPKIHAIADNQPCPETLHPGSEFDIYGSAAIPDMKAVDRGDQGFYVYGDVHYDDFNGVRRRTSFCYRGTETTLLRSGEMRVSINGNSTT